MAAESESDRKSALSWFRTPGGRRFGIEFALIVAGKLVLLVALWALFFRPYPRPDTSPAAIESRLLAPAETAHDR